jgi:GNAT superfamily N-acetyltransferase
VFGAARAAMTYLPRLHTPAEDLAFFAGQVLPHCAVTVARVASGAADRGTVTDDSGPAGAPAELVAFSAAADGWLRHLYVAPPWQGRGIGAALLQRAMAANPDGLSLWAFAENHGALAFYRRAGFAEVLRTDGSANEERRPDVQLRWRGRAKGSAATG